MTPWLVAKRVPSKNGALTTWPILPLPLPGRPFSICAVTSRPGAFMRLVLHSPQEIQNSRSPSPTFLLRSSLALDVLCKSPKAKFVKAQCRVSGSPNIRGARGHRHIYTRFSVVNHWDTVAVNVQGREAHMVARQIESTRSRPLVPGTPDVAWQTHQRRRKRNALHAIPQIHPSSGRHTDIATSAPALGVHSGSLPQSFFSPGTA